MDGFAGIGEFWLYALGWLAGLAVVFGILGRWMPCNPGMYWYTDLRALPTDAVYWFIVPLFMQIARTLMLIAAVALLWGGRETSVLPLQALPLWQQCVAVLLIQDVLLYWIHRAFHTRWAWSFHAIHHSPKVLDWMSMTRFHPVNHLLAFTVADVAVLLLGFAPATLLILAPLHNLVFALVHANLNWTFGPLRYVFASPVFHRWHHTTLDEGLDKNFASTFTFLDVLFGTFYMPAGKRPEQFGNGEPDFPEHFWGQFLYPFRSRKLPSSSSPKQERSNRRPRIAALLVVAALAVVGLFGSRGYWTQPNDPPAGETAPPRVPVGRRAAVLSVAISADGQAIVSGSEDGTVTIWDGATGKEQRSLTGHTKPVLGVAISADGHAIVSGSFDRTVKVWDAGTGQEQYTFTGHPRAVTSVAISADGRRIVSGSAEMAARVWDARTGHEEFTLAGHPGVVTSVAISSDGQRIVTASGQFVKTWDACTGREERTFLGHNDLVHGVAITADGKRIVSGSFDETVKVWDVATGQEELTLTGHKGPVYAVAVSPDGRHILSAGQDQTIKVWDAATVQEEYTLTGHTDAVTSVAMSRDGRRIVSGSRDGLVKAWDVSSSPAEPPLAAGNRPRAGSEPRGTDAHLRLLPSLLCLPGQSFPISEATGKATR